MQVDCQRVGLGLTSDQNLVLQCRDKRKHVCHGYSSSNIQEGTVEFNEILVKNVRFQRGDHQVSVYPYICCVFGS